jgi:hypothetical protein
MSNPYPLAIYEIQTGRLPGWGYEPVRITIPAHTFDEVFEDLPVDLRISADSGANHADLSMVFTALGSYANRKRICVTAGDGLTPCYVEIKEWNTATPTATLTVTVPLVNPGEDTHLYLYYDPEHAEMTDWVTDAPAPPDPQWAYPQWAYPQWAYIYPIACAATDVAVYQQDVVIHRSEGTSYEETAGGLRVWHVYVGNRCKSDYGDVRFTDASGNALAYYLWPDYNSSSARFCVRLAGADVAGELLVWYGNPTATTTSDGDATYHFFDHFEGATLNTTKWSVASGSWTVSDSAVHSSGSHPRLETVATPIASLSSGWIFEVRAKHATYTDENDAFFVRLGTTSGRYIIYHWKKSGNAGELGDPKLTIPGALSGHTWYRFSTVMAGTYAAGRTYADNGTMIGSVTGNDQTSATNCKISLGAYGTNGCFDYIIVRAYSATPPAATAFGPEQEVVTPSDVYLVYDAAPAPLTLAAYVDAYEYLSWTRRYRRPGAWRCQINRYLPAAKEFVPGRLVHFRRNGEDRLGLIETRQISVDTSGRPSEQWTIAGREVLGILGDRLCLHGVSTGTGYDVQTGPAETVMRHYVDANAINPADYTRIVPFLSLAPTNAERGGTTKQSARFDVLADLLESICAASGLGYRGRWSWDDRRLYFEVIEGVDRSDSVKLSPALGNCTIKGYHESTNLAPSVAVVAGQGEAADRMVVDVGTVDGLIGLARRERFVDARDLTTEADLRQRGAEKLAEDGDTTTLEIEYIQTAMYRYGEDFDIGDVVHVEYPDIAAMDARIVEIVEEYAREGERLTLVLGTEWPDLTGVLRLAQKDNVVKRV